MIASWLEIDALVLAVRGFCVEGRFVRPACHLLRKSQQACVVSDKPGSKVTMTNAHPPQDEHSLAHALKTLTSLNKEVRPFFLSDNSIWRFPSVSSLSDYSIWRSRRLF